MMRHWRTKHRCVAAIVCALSSVLSVGLARADDPPLKRFWIGIHDEIDFGYVPSAVNVCKLDANLQPTSGYECDYPSRTDPQQNARLTAAQAGRVNGHFGLLATRFGLALDYAVNASVLLGLRGGWNNGSQSHSAFPAPYLYAEARGTFVFGDRPLARVGLWPYTLVGVGVGEFTSGVSVPVGTAWRVAGPFYTTAGAGVRFGGARSGVMIAPLKMSFAFGNEPMAVLSPEMTIEFGF